MPGAARLRLDLNRNPARIRSIGGKDVDARHVAREGDRVASPPMNLRRDKHLAGPRDLLGIHSVPDCRRYFVRASMTLDLRTVAMLIALPALCSFMDQVSSPQTDSSRSCARPAHGRTEMASR